MNKFLLAVEKYLAGLFILIMGSSWRYKLNTPKPEGRVIYAFWHRNILPLAFLHKFEKICILISSSQDGELIAGPVRLLGYKTPRGSSTRGGGKGLKEMVTLSRKHSLAITPDGPKGPAEKIKEGLLYLAYFTKLPIIPVAVDVKRERVFNSWDKFRLPLLFTWINITYGEPIYINSKEDIVHKAAYVQEQMNNLTINNKIK